VSWLVSVCGLGVAGNVSGAQIASIVLSRPTDRSILVTLIPAESLQVYCEFGTARTVYAEHTEITQAPAQVPCAIPLTGLAPGTRYYYRLRYKPASGPQFLASEEHTFHTQRPRSMPYRFAIEADPHPYDKKGSHSLWPITLGNVLVDSADFLLDLGDTFGDDHNPSTITSEEVRQLHLDCRSYFGVACHSTPLMLCLGNHEGESGYYLLQTPPNNLGVYGTLWRKYYYANPVPDGFYSGNSTVEPFGMGTPENYYAWEWGDALFVVLDAYRYYTANAKPRGWDWTIGKDQYDWFKRTLEGSAAKYRFVITHHTLGETRGGAGTSRLYEWGGYESDGTTWGFTANRPGWAMPIHQIMVKNRVTIYFQGHDHLFAKEEQDGIVYQEVPMPSDSTYIIGIRDNGDAYTGVTIAGSGHLRVTVSPESVLVDYVQAWLPTDEDATRKNRQVAYTYSVKPMLSETKSEEPLPSRVVLEQNFPNPFNPTSIVRFHLPVAGDVRVVVYDLIGREVLTLARGWKEAGVHEAVFDASHLPSGVHFVRLLAHGEVVTRKAIILK
jgi:hypothetical protein